MTVELFFNVLINYGLFVICEELHVHKVEIQGAKSDKPEACPVSPFCYLVQSQDKRMLKFWGTIKINCSHFLVSQRENLKLKEASSSSPIHAGNWNQIPTSPCSPWNLAKSMASTTLVYFPCQR